MGISVTGFLSGFNQRKREIDGENFSKEQSRREAYAKYLSKIADDPEVHRSVRTKATSEIARLLDEHPDPRKPYKFNPKTLVPDELDLAPQPKKGSVEAGQPRFDFKTVAHRVLSDVTDANEREHRGEGKAEDLLDPKRFSLFGLTDIPKAAPMPSAGGDRDAGFQRRPSNDLSVMDKGFQPRQPSVAEGTDTGFQPRPQQPTTGGALPSYNLGPQSGSSMFMSPEYKMDLARREAMQKGSIANDVELQKYDAELKWLESLTPERRQIAGQLRGVDMPFNPNANHGRGAQFKPNVVIRRPDGSVGSVNAVFDPNTRTLTDVQTGEPVTGEIINVGPLRVRYDGDNEVLVDATGRTVMKTDRTRPRAQGLWSIDPDTGEKTFYPYSFSGMDGGGAPGSAPAPAGGAGAGGRGSAPIVSQPMPGSQPQPQPQRSGEQQVPSYVRNAADLVAKRGVEAMSNLKLSQAAAGQVLDYLKDRNIAILDEKEKAHLGDLEAANRDLNRMEELINEANAGDLTKIPILANLVGSVSTRFSRGIYMERGATTDRDVDRAMGLLPGRTMFGAGASVALKNYSIDKLDEVRRILRDAQIVLFGTTKAIYNQQGQKVNSVDSGATTTALPKDAAMSAIDEALKLQQKGKK